MAPRSWSLVRRVMFVSVLLTPILGFAATPVDVVEVDLATLIRGAAESPVQFAVQVPHLVSTTTAGSWTTEGGKSTWHYAVRIPTAVSMSFHATRLQLPASALLTVLSTSTTAVYRQPDVKTEDFYSRVQPGDTLEFSLEVATTDRAGTAIDIISLQAGYRGLTRDVPDHPIYRKLHPLAVASDNSACVQNYQCKVNSANEANGQATVAVLVANLYQCTATLIRDVPNDNTPYLLTARHCQNGRLGGGNPGIASAVTVYWNAVSPCIGPLGSIYDFSTPTQQGATTVVEQEDAWLIKLNESPVVPDAQFAGFDATGGSVNGGYAIHHALSLDKQYTAWFGQAASVTDSNVLGVTYLSHFLKTVNAEGTSGPGASGGALFDQADHLVGLLSLGIKSSDPSGYAACPAGSPQPPSDSNYTDAFTSLAAIWDSTQDFTSSTGSTTVKSVLDPDNTGTRVVASAPVVHLHFTSSHIWRVVGNSIQLTWDAPALSQCTPTGGASGNGWSGALGASGTRDVTENQPGDVTYGLTCAVPGGGSAKSSVTVTWRLPDPQLTFKGPDFPFLWITRPAALKWSSNLEPCEISGGSFAASNLPAAGSTIATQDTPADITYRIICGTAGRTISAVTTVSYVTPSLLFLANGTDRKLGESLELRWRTYADSCAPSGGAPNDGWDVTAFKVIGHDDRAFPRIATLGNYTYTLTCSSGPLSVQKSIDVTVEDDPPYVTASVDKTSVVLNRGASDYITLNWRSNLSRCAPNTSNLGFPVRQRPITNTQYFAEDSEIYDPLAPGTYIVSVECDTAVLNVGKVTSTPITVQVLPPPPPTVTIAANPASVGVGQPFTLTWSSTDAKDCLEKGSGAAAVGLIWGFDSFADISGNQIMSPTSAGSVTLGIMCQSIDSAQGPVSAETMLTVLAPTVTLSSSTTSVMIGQSFTLSWTSVFATTCSAGGGGADGRQWTGDLATSGSITQTATTVGSFDYMVNCGPGLNQGRITIKVSAAPPGAGSSSGGGGGGGSLDRWWVWLLSVTLIVHVARGRVRPRTGWSSSADGMKFVS